MNQEELRSSFEKWAAHCGRVQGWSGEKHRVHREAQLIVFDELITPLIKALSICDEHLNSVTAEQALTTFKEKLNDSGRVLPEESLASDEAAGRGARK